MHLYTYIQTHTQHTYTTKNKSMKRAWYFGKTKKKDKVKKEEEMSFEKYVH